MAEIISVNVRKMYRNGYHQLAAVGASSVEQEVQVREIRTVQDWTDPQDVDVYSIIALRAESGVRTDLYVNETAAAVQALANA